VQTDQEETPKPQSNPSNSAEITLEEYEQIPFNFTLDEVEKIIGSKGKLQSSDGNGQYKTETYKWKL
jgi:hypothetical protein